MRRITRAQSKTPAWIMDSPGSSPVKGGKKVTRNKQHDAIGKHKGKTVKGITEVSKQELMDELEAQRGRSLFGRACCLVKDIGVAYYQNMGRIAYYSLGFLPGALAAEPIAAYVEVGYSSNASSMEFMNRIMFRPALVGAIRSGTAAAIGPALADSYDRNVRQELTPDEYTSYVHADVADALKDANLPTSDGKESQDDNDLPVIASPPESKPKPKPEPKPEPKRGKVKNRTER